MTDFYMGSLNYLTKKRNNIAQSVRDLKKTDAHFDEYRLSTKEHVDYLNTVLNILEHAEIFDLRQLNQFSDNIKDVKYQGHILSNIDEIRMPYEKCYFEMDGLPRYFDTDVWSDTSAFLVWETSYKEIKEVLERWMEYDVKSVNKVGLQNQSTFYDSDRVLFVLGINKTNVKDGSYIFGGAGGLLLNATRPVIPASTTSYTEDFIECFNIDRNVRNLVELCSLNLRPHEYDEYTINAEMGDDEFEIELTYNSMYVDIGFNSEKFRFVSDEGLLEEVREACETNDRKKVSDKGVLYLDVLGHLVSLKEKNFSSDELKREILKAGPSLNDHEVTLIHKLIQSSMDSEDVDAELKKFIDSVFMNNAIKQDLNIPKIFIQFISYMIQNQRVEIIGKYSKSALNRSNLPKRAAKRRMRSIMIKDTRKEITSSFVSSGLGVSKAPHRRRGHKRTYQSGISIWVKECDINAHKGLPMHKQSYKVSMG